MFRAKTAVPLNVLRELPVAPCVSRINLTLAVGGLVLAAACSKPQPQQAAAFKPPPTAIETALVTRQAVADKFTAVGTVEPSESVTVVSEIDGRIVRLPFAEGGQVREGDVLAELDSAQLRAELDRARAISDQRRTWHDRVKNMVSLGLQPPQALDDAVSALRVAEADVALAETRLSKTVVRTPFDGMVGARRVSPGAFVRAGEPVTDVAAIAEIKVSFAAPERYLADLRIGAPLTVSTPAFPDEKLSGRITLVDPALDAASRNARVVARARNPHGHLRPGMSADVVVMLAQRPAALVIPSEAVFVEGEKPWVYVVKADGTVTRRELTLGTRLADAIEVLTGLEAGERVVSAGHQKLYEGATVVAVDEAAAATRSTAPAVAGTSAPAR
jgi:membrane fusion protein (multidrug efflux system)